MKPQSLILALACLALASCISGARIGPDGAKTTWCVVGTDARIIVVGAPVPQVTAWQPVLDKKGAISDILPILGPGPATPAPDAAFSSIGQIQSKAVGQVATSASASVASWVAGDTITTGKK
jgi:hypothetical protein